MEVSQNGSIIIMVFLALLFIDCTLSYKYDHYGTFSNDGLQNTHSVGLSELYC